MTINQSGVASWSSYYRNREALTATNFYPENFVARVFLSQSPVKFVEHDYVGKSVLDLGCGHGRHLPFLMDLGLKPTGLEVAQDQVNQLEQLFPEVPFVVGSASDVPCKNSSFDFVLACNSIYYLSSAQESALVHFKECHRVLKENGIIVFTLMGTQHSIFEGAQQASSDGKMVIESDFLGFRGGVCIQSYNDKFLEQLANLFDVQFTGEVTESVRDHTRHFYYFVAKKVSR